MGDSLHCSNLSTPSGRTKWLLFKKKMNSERKENYQRCLCCVCNYLISLFYLLMRWGSLCLHYCFFSFLAISFISSWYFAYISSRSSLNLSSSSELTGSLNGVLVFSFSGIDTLLIFLFWLWAIVGNQVETQDKAQSKGTFDT